MVKKMRQVLQEFEAQNKPVCLLAVVKMDDLIDKWSILLSAPWVTPDNNRETFEKFVSLIKKWLSPEELSGIARIGIFSNNEHLVGELMKLSTGTELKDLKINGNLIYEGSIIVSRPEICIDTVLL